MSSSDKTDRSADKAIDSLWKRTIKARALCPHVADSAVGRDQFESPEWYRERGAVFFVQPLEPLTQSSIVEINEIGAFINQSFVVALVGVLERFAIVPSGAGPNPAIPGADYVQLAKWLRHCFAHGDVHYDENNAKHVRARKLLEQLFSDVKSTPGFVIAIDSILEPLKDGVLTYVAAHAREADKTAGQTP